VYGHGHNVCASLPTFESRSWSVTIYKVCMASRELVQINSLDEYVEYLQVKPNHIYFTDDSKSVAFKCKLCRLLVIGMLNLETKIMDEIVSPRPWSNCMAPLLMIPNPIKLDISFHS
jgi:hypothetical protein